MMNFLEFAADQYVSFNMEHYFFGYFFNRIPFLKRGKLREVISFKALYGSLSDRNNPNLNGELLQFPTDENGNSTTFLLGNVPYMEASIGLTNVFNFLRIDLIQRLNYLDQPNLPNLFGRQGLGIRANFYVEF